MLKLANVDAAGERALRVVSYYDQLGSNSPDLDAVVRATAVIADCTAGLQLERSGQLLRYSRDGELLNGSWHSPTQTRDLDTEHEEGSVWLERGDSSLELDEFIVERFSLAVCAVVQRQRSSGRLDTAAGLSDPALAQILVNERASETERSRAAQLIGLQPASSIQLLAIEPDEPSAMQSSVASLRQAVRRQVLAAELSRHLTLLIVVGAAAISLDVTKSMGRIGAGPVVDTLEAPASWAAARGALHFAGIGVSWPRALASDEVGVLRMLLELSPETVTAQPDFLAIGRIAAQPSGQASLDILDHFLHTGSLREAARATNFHHSSLQARVARIGREICIDLGTPAGRQRAQLALLLWRLFG